MKQKHNLVLLAATFGIGWLLGWAPWKEFYFGSHDVMIPTKPRSLDHFRFGELPEFASDVFFFREGFGDVDEYLSFVLPPDAAQEFSEMYIKRNKLPELQKFETIPRRALGLNDDDWRQEFWFDDFSELDAVYYEKYLFFGYSKSRNRLFLMNWND